MENAGENAGHENVGHKIAGHEIVIYFSRNCYVIQVIEYSTHCLVRTALIGCFLHLCLMCIHVI